MLGASHQFILTTFYCQHFTHEIDVAFCSALLHRRAERNTIELLLQETDMDAEAVFTSFRLTVAFYE